MTPEIKQFYETRAQYSESKLGEIRDAFADLPELKRYPKLVVYATGSYARLEASQHSDIDVFFVSIGKRTDIENPKTSEIRLFGKVLEEAEKMKLQPFSNDSQYLSLLHTEDILENLGSPTDDHSNYFTARMLLLLESHWLFGESAYDELSSLIVESYFTDFDDHQGTFHPRFLMNDICRYWKTMLLNYENNRFTARNESDRETDPTKIKLIKGKQKVKNYKLKYSRMTTCFATLAALGSCNAPVNQSQVLELMKKTPRERIESIVTNLSAAEIAVETVLEKYKAFLEMTELSADELRDRLMDPVEGKRLNIEANEYGDAMYALLKVIDENAPQLRLIRNMVI